MKNLQQGFSIISAIFVLVVLAFLGAAMVTFSTSQQQSAAMDVMGARAYQAARAGAEWAAYEILRGGGGCAAASAALPVGTLAGTLSGFSVNVACTATAVSEVSAATGMVTIYNINSVANAGTPGQPGYVERQIQLSIAR